MEVVQQEDDVLLSYQVFAGLEYYPTDHFRIGLRYRWMLSEGMDLFSSQELHLGELSLGYSH
jgi:opacity protein-like surface antigen